ncbi:YbaB/EbfC family nucleoid-associated protein [Catenuloplanes japonicus]|uniref:YbaB/EbfC family nucleoid-associated protein n=1 Tax=Catenuloplanes japonicus TaxID=33876 RepID=UPI000527273E|nr:YbaB/EbfC family nucleoid-associated protein [Catenuloplanes japonicus]
MNFSDHIETLFAEYERHRESASDLQRRLNEVSATATSPRREVTVTAGPQGALTGIAFPTGATRRLPPAELAALIMKTYADAREQVMDASAALLAPMLPPGIDAAAMVRGESSTDALMPPGAPPMVNSVREALGLDRSDT